MINCALLMAIEAFLIVDYIICVKLNYHVSIIENMGVVVAGPHPIYGPRAPLVKNFRITTVHYTAMVGGALRSFKTLIVWSEIGWGPNEVIRAPRDSDTYIRLFYKTIIILPEPQFS